jgi:hypothetical protein
LVIDQQQKHGRDVRRLTTTINEQINPGVSPRVFIARLFMIEFYLTGMPGHRSGALASATAGTPIGKFAGFDQ